MSTPTQLRLQNKLTVEQVLQKMPKALIISIFNEVVAAAETKGWGCLNHAEDVFGKPAVDDAVAASEVDYDELEELQEEFDAR